MAGWGGVDVEWGGVDVEWGGVAVSANLFHE